MYTLKKISAEAIPSALQKAERYRLLNEPYEAESICLDILEIDHENRDALIMLLLARTDQFDRDIGSAFTKAMEVLPRLGDRDCRSYYGGIIHERRAKAHLARGGPGSGQLAYHGFMQAMEAYAQVMVSDSACHQDAILRWNTCARILNENPTVVAGEEKSEILHTDSWA